MDGMKLILSIFALVSLIVIPAHAQTGPTYVQSRAADNDSTGQLSITFNNPVRAGSLLVVAIRMSNGGSATITSSPPAAWTQDAWRMSIVSGWSTGVYSAPNVTGGPTTVTASVSGGSDAVRMTIHEYSGVAATSPAYMTSNAASTSGSANSASVTTTMANSLLFCSVATDSDLLGFVAGSGYTLRANGGEKIQTEDRIAATVGTYSGMMGLSSDTWAAILVAYKPSGGGSTVPPPAAPSNLRIIR